MLGNIWVFLGAHAVPEENLTTIAVSTATSMRAKTVNANPTMSVTTFAEDI